MAAPERVELATEYQSIRNAILRPHQVVRLTGYMLRYWPALLGPTQWWIAVAFQQTAYLKGAWQPRTRTRRWFSASGAELAGLISLSESNFWRQYKQSRYLNWLVEQGGATRKYYERGADQKPHRPANTYRVKVDTPFVPAHQALLREMITARLTSRNVLGVLAALDAVRQIKRKDIFDRVDPAEAAPGEVRPLSVRELVQEIVPDLLLSTEETVAVAQACDRLYAHLIPADRDLTFVQVNFIQNYLPRLKHGPALMVVYLRSKTFEDPDEGIRRDTFTIVGGYTTLAHLLGVNDNRTVLDWLRASDDDWRMDEFVRVTSEQRRADGQRDVTFWTRTWADERLTPDQAQWYAHQARQVDAQVAAPEPDSKIRGKPPAINPDEPPGKSRGNGHVAEIEESQEPGHKDGGMPTGHTPFSGEYKAAPDGKNRTVKSSFQDSSPHRELVDQQQTDTADGRAELAPDGAEVAVAAPGAVGDWDLRVLLKAARITAAIRDQLLDNQPPAVYYVGLILWAASRWNSTTQRGIDDPPIYAARQALDYGPNADEPCDAIASLGREATTRILAWIAECPDDGQGAWLPEPQRDVGVEYAALFRNVSDADRTRRAEMIIRGLGLRDLAKAFRAELSARRRAEEKLEAGDQAAGWGPGQDQIEPEATDEPGPQLADEPIRFRITAQEAWISAGDAHAPFEAASAYRPNSRAATRQERLPALLLGYADQELPGVFRVGVTDGARGLWQKQATAIDNHLTRVTGRPQRAAFEVLRDGVNPDETIRAECGELSLASPRQVWEAVLAQLKLELPRSTFDTWVADTQAISFDNGELIIGVPNPYTKNWLDNRLISSVRRTLTNVAKWPLQAQFVVSAGSQFALEHSAAPPAH